MLGFLYAQPDHGYSLHQKLASEFSYVWHVRQSQTYNILKRLETQGFISSTTQEQEKLPPRQMLQITEQGRRRFEEWLHAPSGSSVRSIRLEFITRLYFAQKLFPELAPIIIQGEAADIDTALVKLEKSLKCADPEQVFNRLGLELRIQQPHSVKDWLNECRKAFEI